MIVVHVTHEAVDKVGGIGSVVAGLMTARAYSEAVDRTILVGPLLSTDTPASHRLGDGGRALYSSLDGIDSGSWGQKFHAIERTYDVGIIYGTRVVREDVTDRQCEAEVLLIDVFHANKARLDLFKADLYRMFAVPSVGFEDIWEYEQYVRLAEPAFEALHAVGADGADEQVVLLAHEYMGMPTALKAVLASSVTGGRFRTVFYAHEVASARLVVEKTPGHDTTFYNVMAAAREDGRTLEEVFPQVLGNFKHALVKAGRYCDHVFAVGDYARRELQFLDHHFDPDQIDLIYNGLPTGEISPDEKLISRHRMRAYAQALFGREPTWIFTHVARPVLSKGIWRDLRVLHEMEPLLRDRGETAVYFMLGTLAGRRRGHDVRHMERVYGWPVVHKEGYPDLACGEEVLGGMFDHFNREHQAVSAVFVNQWGWGGEVCGHRMPEEMTFADIRRGTDVEFGLSVYEPFGISQFEPLGFGAQCVVSNVCGCAGFAQRVAQQIGLGTSVLIADLLTTGRRMSVDELMGMPVSERDEIETAEARRLAGIVTDRLCRGDPAADRRIRHGHEMARRMSWDHVVAEYFLPALAHATGD